MEVRKKTSSLSVRDIVLVGVLSSVIVFLEIVVSMLLMPLMPLMFLVGTGVSGFLVAPVFLLMIFKVNKPGALFLSSVIRAAFYTLMGWPTMFLVMIPIAFVGEWILSRPEAYRAIRWNTFAFVVYNALYSLHGVFLLSIFGYQLFFRSGQFSPEQLASLGIYYVSPVFILVIFLSGIAGASMGCWFGWRILQKHFIKSGLIHIQQG